MDEENITKRNFFQKVGAIFGIKKNQPPEDIIEHNINIDEIEIKDFVLSKNDLECTPVPVVKNFLFQDDDAIISKEMNARDRSRSSLLSTMSKDVINHSAWWSWNIF